MTRTENETIAVDFKWRLDFSARDKEELAESHNITKDAIITIYQDGRTFDGGRTVGKYGPGGLWVASNGLTKRLRINVGYTAEDPRYKGITREIRLDCRDDNIGTGRESKGRRLYTENTRRSISGLYDVVHKSYQMKVTLSLGGCEVKGKEVECSLNVVT